jgi:hypothetical protein
MLPMAFIAGCLGVAAASGYEIYEWVLDHWFGRHLFIGETDTIAGLADGFLGDTLLAVWALARCTSRRVPARLARDVLGAPSAERRPSS